MMPTISLRPTFPTLPQNDARPDRREAALARAKSIYQFDFSYHDIGFTKRLPLLDRINPRWRLKAGLYGGTAALNEALSRLLSPESHYYSQQVRRLLGKLLGDYQLTAPLPNIPPPPDSSQGRVDRREFYGPAEYMQLYRLIQPPAAVPSFALDWYFAYQRVAGTNPVLITRARDELPGRLSKSALEKLGKSLGKRVRDAIAEKDLYYVDFEILANLETSSPKGDFARQFLSAPIAFFARDPERAALRPVAIKIDQPKKAPLFVPSDGAAWTMAKIAVQACDSVHHGIVMHNVHCHLTMAWIALATHRTLAPWHPVMILLSPHFAGTLFVNMLTKRLIEPGGNTILLQSTDLEGTLALLRRAMARYRWNASGPDRHFSERGVETNDELPCYPMRDDALAQWRATHTMVESYIRLYYGSDDDVAGDTELQAWIAELQSERGARLKDIGEVTDPNQPGTLQTVKSLVRLVAQIIHRASTFHTVINYSVYEFMGFAPNMPGALYAPPPAAKESYSRADVLRMLPPMDQAFAQILDTYLVGNLYTNRLGHYPSYHFRDPRVAPIVSRYRKQLDYLEGDIERLNLQRPAPYDVLLPSRVAASIVV